MKKRFFFSSVPQIGEDANGKKGRLALNCCSAREGVFYMRKIHSLSIICVLRTNFDSEPLTGYCCIVDIVIFFNFIFVFGFSLTDFLWMVPKVNIKTTITMISLKSEGEEVRSQFQQKRKNVSGGRKHQTRATGFGSNIFREPKGLPCLIRGSRLPED
jgi:hypothetical protein